ncbi:hypothetical protein V1478_008834, partial [Vespula squamosa]
DNQYLLAGHVLLATTSFLKIYLGHSRANWRTLCKNHAKAKRELARDRPRKLLFRFAFVEQTKVPVPTAGRSRLRPSSNTLGFCVPAPPPGDDLIPRPMTSDPLDDPAHRLPDTYQIYLLKGTVMLSVVRACGPLERAREIYDSRQKLSAPVSAVDDNGPPCGVPLEGSTLVTMSRELPRATQNSRLEDAQLITHNVVLTQKLSLMYCKLHARGPCRPESREYFVLSTGVALQTQSASTKWFRVYGVNKKLPRSSFRVQRKRNITLSFIRLKSIAFILFVSFFLFERWAMRYRSKNFKKTLKLQQDDALRRALLLFSLSLQPGGKISSFCAIGHCMGADSQAAACCSD